MKTLLVVDMLRGFCEPGFPLSMGQSTTSLESYIRSLGEEFLERGWQLIFVCDAHRPDDPEFDQYPQHCLEGTEEAQIVSSLAGLVERALVVPKRVFSPFFGTDLGRVLGESLPDEVHVVGLCTDICVLFTVEGLRNRGFPVVVHERGVMASAEARQAWALGYLRGVMGCRVERSS